MGKYLMIIGAILTIIGLFIYISEEFNPKWISWFGNLPGDIKVEKEKFRFYFPLTSMLLLSIVLSVIIKIIRKLV